MHVPIDSPAVAHGVGLFETMLVERGQAVLAPEHFARMQRSAAALGFPPPDREAFDGEVSRAAASAAEGEAALRCVYIAGGGDLNDPWTLAAHAHPIAPATLARRAHGRVVLLDRSLVRSLPEHKLTSYAACVIGLRRAAAAGADEGLFVTPEGRVLEGTSTNVFAVTSRGVVTAPLSAGILPGIMRAWVLAEAARAGVNVEERAPSPGELREGSFLTGSLTLLAPVRVLDGEPCADAGAFFEHLTERWRR